MKSRILAITDPARSDLQEVRRYTFRQYGRSAADAYDALLKQALRDIRYDPFRPGSKDRSEIGANVRTYHTAFSRERSASGLKSPRHFILYFLSRDNELVVSRVLHDSRDLARHIPAGHLKRARTMTSKRQNERKPRK